MRKSLIILVLMIGSLLLVSACAKEEVVKTGDSLIDFIKNEKLANYQSRTIGNAFDSYKQIKKREWKRTALTGGQGMVDFSGWFGPDSLSDKDKQEGITDRGIDIAFIVETNGSFYIYLVSVIESTSDGKVRRNQALDTATILSDIYANRKVVL